MKEPKIRFKEFSGEWKTYKIGELTSITTGATPSTSISSYWDNGKTRWMSSGELNNRHIYDVKGRITEEGYHSCGTHLIPPYCVLIGLAGQGKTRGTAAINHVELCTNQSIAALLPNPKLFDSSFLYHYIDNKYLELRGMSTGDGGRGGLNKQILLDFEVKLPSMEEQIALASYLDSIDTLIQSTTKKIESLKQVKAASSQSMFPQEGETTPRVRFKGFEGEWEKVKLGDVLTYEQPSKYLVTNTEYEKSGVPVLTAGKTFVLGYTSDTFGLYTDLPVIIFDDFTTESKFVDFLFKAKSSAMKMLNTARDMDVDIKFVYETMKNIRYRVENHQRHWLSVFSKITIKIPSISEQRAIASYFTNLDSQITLQTQRLEKLKQIKSACLDNMFV
ncbi:MAG: restriction endonuclease subunit S [Segatella copri]